ncbi:DUF742 domain-containing protein [Amycolatopsis antarctica]|uniref:DUF742 domain-containing protein n=1 Tax=Amycolatopsis antarctica TaxID=1854586 RepID=UPI0026B27F6E
MDGPSDGGRRDRRLGERPARPPEREGEAEVGEPDDIASGLVRPYFRTRGRTRSSRELQIESLVSTTDAGRRLDEVRSLEHREICRLCSGTRSVAEVAALLRVPLGVARVLIGDTADLGLVRIHGATSEPGGRPSVDFMQRVLRGLQGL